VASDQALAVNDLQTIIIPTKKHSLYRTVLTTMSTHAATTSAVFALGKAACRIVDFLPALKEDTDILGFTVDDLTAEIKLLGLGCDSAHATLQGKVEQRETTHLTHAVDNGLWDCLVMQVEEASRTLQELELFIQNVRREVVGHVDKGKEMATTRTRVIRHIDDLYLTMLLTNM
jgi:chitinase